MRKEDFPVNEYEIGDWVEVVAKVSVSRELVPVGEAGFPSLFVERRFSSGFVMKKGLERKPLSKPVEGQIVGIKRFYLGWIIGSMGEGYLDVLSSELVWEIKSGWTNRIICARPADVSRLLENKELPFVRQDQPSWDDRVRQYLSEEAKSRPRDEKGRWV